METEAFTIHLQNSKCSPTPTDRMADLAHMPGQIAECCIQCLTVLHTMLDSADLGDEILEVGITFRVRREGEGLLLDGSEHVRYGVALEG